MIIYYLSIIVVYTAVLLLQPDPAVRNHLTHGIARVLSSGRQRRENGPQYASH